MLDIDRVTLMLSMLNVNGSISMTGVRNRFRWYNVRNEVTLAWFTARATTPFTTPKLPNIIA